MTGSPLEGYFKTGWTGSGKSGDEIPLFGRIVAIADVYDALMSVRVYKEAWDETKLFGYLKRGREASLILIL